MKKTAVKNKKTAKRAVKKTSGKAKAPAHPVKEFVTKDMFVADAVSKYPESVDVFSKYGLHCIGCFASQLDTVESGAKVHGINVEHLLYDVNKHIGKSAHSKVRA